MLAPMVARDIAIVPSAAALDLAADFTLFKAAEYLVCSTELLRVSFDTFLFDRA